MGTTTRGYPFPESTDPPSGGAAAMQALAEAVDADVADVVLPDPSAEPDGQVLTVSSGAWVAAAPTGGGGGLILVAAGTVTADATPHIDDVFTTESVRWRVDLWDMTAATANYLRLRARAAGVDDTGTYRISYYGNIASGTGSEDKAFIGWASDGGPSRVTIELTRPADAAASVADVRAAGWIYHETTVFVTPANAFDGFTLYNDSAAALTLSWAVSRYSDEVA